MRYVYVLEHSYEYEFEGELFDEIKMIGVYSTKEKVEEVIEKYMNYLGLKTIPRNAFI